MVALVPNLDPNINFPVPDKSVGSYFPLNASPPVATTFEIGLVLGGTASAAAYTAGVLDFLVEALDAWTVAKNCGDLLAPQHNILIRIITGTSGGALSCVLLARTIGFAFPACTDATPLSDRALNPLYNVWVNEVDITNLLETGDLEGQEPLSSILCADKLDEICERMASYQGAGLGTYETPYTRDYIERLLPVVLTLTNLRGIPYSAHFRGPSDRPEYYMDHADHIRFRVDISGTHPLSGFDLQPYETGISAQLGNWNAIIHAARGSSAIPVGLPPQVISRDAQHYRYRYAVVNGDAVWLRPAWPYMLPIGSAPTTSYEFLCVDGGCFDNEPISYAREWLAGVLGHNERAPNGAHRAVILVDPFADAPTLGSMTDDGMLDTGGATLGSLTSGGRYQTADLDLFTSESVFSRFLVNPVRQDPDLGTVAGGTAIATASLGAFGGFLSQAFRAHDFFLGRRNCQQFLRASFMLGPNNSLFQRWTADQRRHYQDAQGFLPVVPLMSKVADEIPQPMWPKNAFDPASIRSAVDKRLSKLIGVGGADITHVTGPLGWLLDAVARRAGAAGTDKILNMITSGLHSWRLL